MSLPRWTVYPALAVLALTLVYAVPRKPTEDPYRGAASSVRPPEPATPVRAADRNPTHPELVVLGIDGMDPDLLAEALELYPDRMPNFRWLVEQGGIHSLGTSAPPQSPVAWSNFITGLDSGGHGVFDFIHRDPTTRALASCTTTAVTAFEIPLPGKWKLDVPSGGDPSRTGDAFWELLMEDGVPADIWRMPANFPVEKARGLSFSGMLTPAVDSAYGQSSFYTTDPMRSAAIDYSKVELVREFDGVIETSIGGPANALLDGNPPQTVNLTVLIDREAGAVAFDTGDEAVVLEPGEWSDFVRVTYKPLPLGMMAISGICRIYLRSIEPEVEFYVSPVNIDPEAPMAPVSEPSGASSDLTEGIGRYYTQGMAEDVNSLKNEVLSDAEFMRQVELVYQERRNMLDYSIDEYLSNDDGGFLFFYFSTVDLACHMMWRHFDTAHPDHDEAIAGQDSSWWSGRQGSTWKDTVHELYVKMDPVLGRVRERLGDDVPLIVMSDHGFAPYRRMFDLNRWLWENGYLVLKDGFAPEDGPSPPEHEHVYIFAGAVDWTETRAYGMGFNGLYLNRSDREQDIPGTDEDETGIVSPEEAPALLAELKAKLEAEMDDATGVRPIVRCDLATEIYRGERTPEAPDMVVGYNAGYGNSDAASTGRITNAVLQDNLGGSFNGSHLMVPDVVSGILLTNQTVREGEHDLCDLTVEILDYYGVEPTEGMRGHPVLD